MWKGPSTVGGVAPSGRRPFIITVSIDRPSTSDARIASMRLSSEIWPTAVIHWMPAIHSSWVSCTSRAKACRCLTRAGMISASRGLSAVPQRRMAISVMLSSVTKSKAYPPAGTLRAMLPAPAPSTSDSRIAAA